MKPTKTTFKKLIMDELKSKGLHSIANKIYSIKYETYSGGDSVRVYTTNLFKTERKTLDAILDCYQDGDFDGMNDLYTHRKGQARVRTAKYVMLNNKYTQEVENSVIEHLKNHWDVYDDKTAQAKFRCWFDSVKHRFLTNMESSIVQESEWV